MQCVFVMLVKEQQCYWAVQAGLLTPLTFTLYCLSPLAAFTSGVCFLYNGRQ